jgi:predicted permease
MFEVLTVIAPLFIIIFATAILQRFNALGDDWAKVLNDFALKIGLPVLIFSSLVQAPLSFTEQVPIIAINSLFILTSFILALILGKIGKLNPQMIRTLFICLGFGNIAYLGIPVLLQIEGNSILPTASLIVAIYLFWFFSVGISYLDYLTTTDKRNVLMKTISKLFTDPLLIAVIIGIVVGSIGITLPNILLRSLDMINASVTPTVLIVIGLFIGKSPIGKAKEWIPIIVFSLTTLFLLPAGLYYSINILGLSPTQFSSSIIQAAMPLAITPFALADKYNLDKVFIARSIVLSTILSILTLPFWINFIT